MRKVADTYVLLRAFNYCFFSTCILMSFIYWNLNLIKHIVDILNICCLLIAASAVLLLMITWRVRVDAANCTVHFPMTKETMWLQKKVLVGLKWNSGNCWINFSFVIFQQAPGGIKVQNSLKHQMTEKPLLYSTFHSRKAPIEIQILPIKIASHKPVHVCVLPCACMCA